MRPLRLALVVLVGMFVLGARGHSRCLKLHPSR